jgi:hypothetical protein
MSEKRGVPLERSTIEAYCGIVAGIIGAIVTSWLIKALLLAGAAGLLVHAVFRAKRTIDRPLWWKTVASFVIVTAFVAIGWEPIASEFRKSTDTQAPIPQPPIAPPSFNPADRKSERPISRLERLVYLCRQPSLPGSGEEIAKARERIKQGVAIYAAATGLPFTLSEIDNGIAYEVRYPNGLRPDPDILSVRFEIRRFEDKLLVTNITEMKIDSQLTPFSKYKPAIEASKILKATSEKLAGVPAGTCSAL